MASQYKRYQITSIEIFICSQIFYLFFIIKQRYNFSVFVKQCWLSKINIIYLNFDEYVKTEVLNKTYRAYMHRRYAMGLALFKVPEPDINSKRKYEDLHYYLHHCPFARSFGPYELRPIAQQIDQVKHIVSRLSSNYKRGDKNLSKVIALHEPRMVKTYFTPELAKSLCYEDFSDAYEKVIENGDTSLLPFFISPELIERFKDHLDEIFLHAAQHERLEMMTLIRRVGIISQDAYKEAFINACGLSEKMIVPLYNCLRREAQDAILGCGLLEAVLNGNAETLAYLLDHFIFDEMAIAAAFQKAIEYENKPLVALLRRKFTRLNGVLSSDFFIKAARLNLTEVFIHAFEKKLLSSKKIAFIFKRCQPYENDEIFALFLKSVKLDRALFFKVVKRIYSPTQGAFLMSHPICDSFSRAEWQSLFAKLSAFSLNHLIKEHCLNHDLTVDNWKIGIQEACSRNNFELFKMLLDFTSSYFPKNVSYFSVFALTEAAEKGNARCVEISLVYFFYINEAEIINVFAAIKKDSDEIYYLMRSRIRIPLIPNMLPIAAEFGDVDVVRLILQRHTDLEDNIIKSTVQITQLNLNVIQLIADYHQRIRPDFPQDLWGKFLLRATSANAELIVNFMLREKRALVPPRYIRASLGLAVLFKFETLTKNPLFGDPITAEEIREYLEIYCEMNFFYAVKTIIDNYENPDPGIMGRALFAACVSDNEEIAELLLPYTTEIHWRYAYDNISDGDCTELLIEYARERGIILDQENEE